MTIIELHEMFGTDDRCREILERLRWPEGVTCPRCKHRGHSWLEAYNRYECNECEHQFTVISGTVFQDTHLELTKWFVAIYLLCESRKGMSANQIKRIIGGSYKTAWYLCHRIRAAMKDTDRPMMDGTIEVDETYIGGKHKGIGSGNYRDTKAIVIGIRQRDGDLKLIHCKGRPTSEICAALKEHVSEDAEVIVTDESQLYPGALPATQREKRRSVNHRAKEYVRYEDGFMVTTNTVESAFSLFKRGIAGAWHKVSVKHLAAYLDEMTFRFNRRQRSDLFIDTLRHMITADPLTFEKLTA